MLDKLMLGAMTISDLFKVFEFIIHSCKVAYKINKDMLTK